MKISPVRSAPCAFCAEGKGKKLNKKAVGKAAAISVAAAGAYAFATQKGQGGLVDFIIDKAESIKATVLSLTKS